MQRTLRSVLLVISIIQAFFAVAFFFQWPIAVQIWPWPNTGRLSYYFISSIFAAAAAATLWCLWAREHGALAGIGLDYLTIFAPIAILSFQVAGSAEDSAVANAIRLFGVSAVLGALFGLAIFLWANRIPFRDPRPMPALVRWSFVIFIIALLIVGGSMVLKTPNILPWPLTEELSVVIGWMYLGAAAYFAYALLRPGWGNTAGQLVGFLAYDIVLIVPFLERLSTVPPEFQASQIVYTAIVIYSGLLAIYFLFLSPRTRIWGAMQLQTG
jgi:hypothetical protein